jgi:hypothetical protein
MSNERTEVERTGRGLHEALANHMLAFPLFMAHLPKLLVAQTTQRRTTEQTVDNDFPESR